MKKKKSKTRRRKRWQKKQEKLQANEDTKLCLKVEAWFPPFGSILDTKNEDLVKFAYERKEADEGVKKFQLHRLAEWIKYIIMTMKPLTG